MIDRTDRRALRRQVSFRAPDFEKMVEAVDGLKDSIDNKTRILSEVLLSDIPVRFSGSRVKSVLSLLLGFMTDVAQSLELIYVEMVALVKTRPDWRERPDDWLPLDIKGSNKDRMLVSRLVEGGARNLSEVCLLSDEDLSCIPGIGDLRINRIRSLRFNRLGLPTPSEWNDLKRENKRLKQSLVPFALAGLQLKKGGSWSGEFRLWPPFDTTPEERAGQRLVSIRADHLFEALRLCGGQRAVDPLDKELRYRDPHMTEEETLAIIQRRNRPLSERVRYVPREDKEEER